MKSHKSHDKLVAKSEPVTLDALLQRGAERCGQKAERVAEGV